MRNTFAAHSSRGSLVSGSFFRFRERVPVCVSALALAVAVASLPGCMVTKREHEALDARTREIGKEASQARADVIALRAELEATRQRLDNALRANADSSG